MSKGVGQFPKGIDPALIHLTGTIVTWWGRIEGIMVNDLVTLRQLTVNADLAAKESFPVSTGRIIEQWARMHRRYYADDPARLDKLGLLKGQLTQVSEERNVLVHYFWPYGANDGQETINLKSIKPQKGNNQALVISMVEISVEKLDALNERLVKLNHQVMVDSMNFLMKVNRQRFRPVKGSAPPT